MSRILAHRFALLAALFPACPALAAGQCVPLGTPGATGSIPCIAGLPPPSIACSGSPQVGNSAFSILGSPSFNGAYPVWVAFGLCDPTPDLLPTLATCPVLPTSFPYPICPAGPGGSFAYIEGLPFAMVPEMCCPFPSFFVPIPNQPALVGVTVCAQGLGVNAFAVGGLICFQITNGLSITIL